MRLALLLLAVVVWLPVGHPTAWGQTDDRRFAEGLLFEVSRGETAPSYVFGTVHISDERVADFPEPLVEVLDRVDSLSLEVLINPQTQAQLAMASMTPAGEPALAELLDEERYDRMVAIAGDYGVPAGVLLRFRPWAAAFVLSMPPAEIRRAGAGYVALDRALQNHAALNGIAVYGLETPDEQIALMERIREEHALAMLEQAIDQHHQVEVAFEVLVAHYLEGRIGDLLDWYVAQSAGEMAPVIETFLEDFLYRRNDLMVLRMGERLAGGNALFAVGAFHLTGPRGILAQLEDKGYEVQRLY